MALLFTFINTSVLKVTIISVKYTKEVEMRLLSGFVALQAIKADPGITIELQLCTDKDSSTGVLRFAETTERTGFEISVSF